MTNTQGNHIRTCTSHTLGVPPKPLDKNHNRKNYSKFNNCSAQKSFASWVKKFLLVEPGYLVISNSGHKFQQPWIIGKRGKNTNPFPKIWSGPRVAMNFVNEAATKGIWHQTTDQNKVNDNRNNARQRVTESFLIQKHNKPPHPHTTQPRNRFRWTRLNDNRGRAAIEFEKFFPECFYPDINLSFLISSSTPIETLIVKSHSLRRKREMCKISPDDNSVAWGDRKFVHSSRLPRLSSFVAHCRSIEREFARPETCRQEVAWYPGQRVERTTFHHPLGNKPRTLKYALTNYKIINHRWEMGQTFFLRLAQAEEEVDLRNVHDPPFHSHFLTNPSPPRY